MAPSWGVVSCAYQQWFRPYSRHRRYCHLPVSGRRMLGFLQFRLGCHGLPIAAGRFAGAAHVDRAQRVCLFCNSGAVGDERHLIFYCIALAPLRSQHAGLFTGSTDTMRSFLLSLIMWGIPLRHRLSRFHEDLNMIAIVGTSDQPCWLAEACKILLVIRHSAVSICIVMLLLYMQAHIGLGVDSSKLGSSLGSVHKSQKQHVIQSDDQILMRAEALDILLSLTVCRLVRHAQHQYAFELSAMHCTYHF